jgi:hypothetical protein
MYSVMLPAAIWCRILSGSVRHFPLVRRHSDKLSLVREVLCHNPGKTSLEDPERY